MADSTRLFPPDMPPGFAYREGFIDEAEERELLSAIRGVADWRYSVTFRTLRKDR